MSTSDSSDILSNINLGKYKCIKNECGKSVVWKHFKEIIDTETNLKLEYVQCNYCKSILKYKSAYGSSRLSRHAKTCSPPGTSSKPLETYFCSSSKQVSLKEKHSILESCVKLCSEDLRPFDIVEGEGFLHLAQNLINLGASLGKVKVTDIIPHRTTISKHVRLTAENCRRQILPHINSILQDVGGALTTDMWTEPFRQVSYICITCHYVDENFDLKPLVLSTCSFPNISKTGANILNEILDNLKNIGFDISVLSKCIFVTDEGSNIVSALNCYKRLTCICHLLNTILKHSFTETAQEFPILKSSVEKCKSLVRYLKKSGAVNELDKTVHQEVESRWNTLCLMLRSVLVQFSEIKNLLEKRQESHRLHEINSEVLETLLDFLKIFEEASTHLESDLNPTLHRVLLWKEYLKKSCAPNITDSDLEKCLKQKTEKWLAKKIKIDEVHKIATFLHPKYKSLKMLTDEEKITVYSQVRQMLPEHVSNTTNYKLKSIPNHSNDIFEEWADKNVQPIPDDEVQNYVQLLVNDDVNDENILTWWKNSPFPNLAKVARRILSIPASSTTSERDFSFAGRVLEERRCNLSPDSVDAILFLKNYGKFKVE